MHAHIRCSVAADSVFAAMKRQIQGSPCLLKLHCASASAGASFTNVRAFESACPASAPTNTHECSFDTEGIRDTPALDMPGLAFCWVQALRTAQHTLQTDSSKQMTADVGDHLALRLPRLRLRSVQAALQVLQQHSPTLQLPLQAPHLLCARAQLVLCLRHGWRWSRSCALPCLALSLLHSQTDTVL